MSEDRHLQETQASRAVSGTFFTDPDARTQSYDQGAPTPPDRQPLLGSAMPFWVGPDQQPAPSSTGHFDLAFRLIPTDQMEAFANHWQEAISFCWSAETKAKSKIKFLKPATTIDLSRLKNGQKKRFILENFWHRAAVLQKQSPVAAQVWQVRTHETRCILVFLLPPSANRRDWRHLENYLAEKLTLSNSLNQAAAVRNRVSDEQLLGWLPPGCFHQCLKGKSLDLSRKTHDSGSLSLPWIAAGILRFLISPFLGRNQVPLSLRTSEDGSVTLDAGFLLEAGQAFPGDISFRQFANSLKQSARIITPTYEPQAENLPFLNLHVTLQRDSRRCLGETLAKPHFSASGAHLSLAIIQTRSELRFDWICAPQWRHVPWVAALAHRFQDSFLRVMRDSKVSLAQLRVPGIWEQRRLASTKTLMHSARDENLVAQFHQQALTQPDQIALYFQNHSITYAALKRRAESIACWLLAQGMHREEPVVLLLQPQADFVAAFLGILQAGGVALAVDLNHPAARLASLIGECHPRFGIYRGSHPLLKGEWGLKSLNLGTMPCDSSQTPSFPPIHPQNLAYLIYTSGSTGKPKAVMATHSNLCRRIGWLAKLWPYAPEEAAVWKKSPSLIGSLPEIFAPLLGGIPLHIAPQPVCQDPYQLLHFLDTRRITRLWGSPSFLTALLETMNPDYAYLRHIRRVISSGDMISKQLAQAWLERVPQARLYNVYGSSETASDISLTELKPAHRDVQSIGRPFPGSQFHVATHQGQKRPLGISGKLWISGAQLGRGYWDSPRTTALCFRPDPFSALPGNRIFDSGDLALISEVGNTLLLGRCDDLLNLRGYRIAPAEIEKAITRFPGIRAAGVTLSAHASDPKLVGFLVLNSDTHFDSQAMRQHLQTLLPNHMIPNHFQSLSSLPRTRSGKLDRLALKAIDPDFFPVRTSYQAPRNSLEQRLATIWQSVLGCEQVGIHAHFFELGGHSLLATRILTGIRERFGYELPMAFFFRFQTIADQAIFLAKLSPPHTQTALPIHAVTTVEAALTPEQLGIWFQHHLSHHSNYLHLHKAWEITNVNPALLVKALELLQRRHAALRSVFGNGPNGPFFKILDHATPHIRVIDQQHSSAGRATFPLQLPSISSEPFDLNSPPWRSYLFLGSHQRTVLWCSFHHLITDGWSLQILERELQRLVHRLQKQPSAELPKPACTFAKYAHWRAEREKRQPLETIRSYWKKQLAKLPGMPLFADGAHGDVLDFRGKEWRQKLPQQLHLKLNTFCLRHRVSPFHACLAIFAKLLARRSDQDDLTLLTPFANRNDTSLERTVGMFVQTMILRLKAPETDTYLAWVKHTRRVFNDAMSHHGLAFADMLRSAGHQTSLHNHPALRTMFAYYPLPPSLPKPPEDSAQKWRDLAPEYHTSQFDLTLNLVQRDADLELRFQFRTAVFSLPSISQLGNQFLTLLEQSLEQPDQAMSGLSGVPAEELSWDYRPQALAHPKRTPIHNQVFAAAVNWPHRTACVYQERGLTFEQLIGSAQRLCRQMQQQGLNPGDYVALFATPSLDLPVAWLACMFGGFIGMPLDPTWPQLRVRHFISSLNLKLAIRTGDLTPSFPIPITCLEVALVSQASLDHPPTTWPSAWPAYAMATSGSTGTPKTVLISHYGLANRFAWMDQCFPTSPAPITLQTTPPLFDSSIWELFWPLIHGGQTVLARKEESLSGNHLAELIERHQITIMDSVPSVFTELLLDFHGQSLTRFSSLKVLILGSEDFPFSLTHRISAVLPNVAQWNLYGPTEATIGCIAYQIDGSEKTRIPIGKPIQGTSSLLLGSHFQPVPRGMPGQLYLAGHCLGVGYVNAPKATAAAFLPHPFSKVSGARIYRSGDMVRRLPDGNIVFCGRLDHQIKIHGIRIEPLEIENHLVSHPSISACAIVLVQTPCDHQQLVAYVVPEKNQPVSIDVWEAHLRKHLPETLIPQHFAVITKLPKNAAGKLDRNALPKPQAQETRDDVQAPQTRMEAALVRLFEQVLRIRPVGIHDSFFELGGQSISAMRLIARLRSDFQLDPPLRILFEMPTPFLLAKELISLKGQAGLNPSRIDPQEPLPLTFVQERLWFLAQLEPHGQHYHLRLIKTLKNLALPALETAFDCIEQRHELWRGAIVTREGQPTWEIHPFKPRSLRYIDLSRLPEALRNRQAALLADHETARPFNLAEPPLQRQLILRKDGGTHALVFTCHHVLADGWSMALWEQELSSFYRQALGLPHRSLPPLPLQFVDIAHWQRERFSETAKDQLLAYWRPKLQGIKPLQLMPKWPTHLPAKGSAFEATLKIDPSTWAQIKTQTNNTGTTPFIWVLSILKILLYRYSHQEIICVGTPVAGRDLPQAEPLLGCFLNTLPLATDLTGNPSFRQVLMSVRETFLGGLAHQEIPFEYLIDQLGLARDLDHAPLFQVLLVWEDQEMAFPAEEGLFSKQKPAWNPLPPQTKYDLTCDVRQNTEGLHLAFRFPKTRYPADLAPLFSRQFRGLVQAVLEDSDKRIQTLPLTPSKTSWALRLPAPLPPPSFTLPEFVGAVALCHPQAIALAQGDTVLSYQQMDQLATRLAGRLLALGYEAETVIAFAMPRSPLSIITMLGILRAGYTFIALDPKLPRKRRQYVLKDSRARFMITDADHPEDHFRHGLPQLTLRFKDLPQLPRVSGLRQVFPDQLAYLVYTSGSTGKPKGIAVSHRAIVAYVHATNARYHLSQKDRVLQIASAAFDASYRDIFGALLAGAQLVIPFENETGDLFALCRYLSRWRMTIVYSGVPSFLKLLAEEAESHGPAFANLRLMISGGERLFWRDVRQFQRSFGSQVAVYNQYGLSETCVTVTSFAAVPGCDDAHDVPMGPPLPYAQTYLLSKHLGSVPSHGVGQVFVSGPAHARCYWGKPRLTAQKIIPDPLATEPGSRLFDTGDLAYFAEKAHHGLRFIGRRDHQVKIRGQRVEIAEIEASLRGHSAVAGCAVRFLEAPVQRLIAFLKVTANQAYDLTTWRKYLEAKLPAVMIPDEYVILEKFPRLANNKINYAALPLPTNTTDPDALPKMETNASTLALLTHIWSQVLGRTDLKACDHFFLSGGHSLLATQVVARIRQGFGIQLPLRTLFEKQVLSELAAAIDEQRQLGQTANGIQLKPRLANDPAILSSAQKRLWFLEELEPGRHRFHIPVAFRIKGPSTSHISQVLAVLLQKHPGMRTAIKPDKDEPRPILLDPERFQAELIDLSGLPDFLQNSIRQRLAAREARILFQLRGSRLYRHRLLKLGPGHHILLQTYHHLIADGWSLGIVEGDLRSLLRSDPFSISTKSHAPLDITYFDWAQWQKKRMQGGFLKKRLSFWKRAVAGITALHMPQLKQLDKPTRGLGDRFGFNIPAPLVQHLKRLGHKQGCTLFTALHAAFEALLYRYSGQKDFCIGVPFANREATQTERIVGLFVNTLPLRAQLNGDPNFHELMVRIRDHSLEAFSHSDFPLEQLVQALDTPRNLARTPLFQVTLVFHQPLAGFPNPEAGPRDLDIVRLKHRPTTAKYDLSAHFEPLGEGLRANFIYDLDRFSDQTIRNMAEHFLTILKWVGQNAQASLTNLPLISTSEYHALAKLNQTQVPRPRATLGMLFLQQALVTPDAAALTFRHNWWTYHQLASRVACVVEQLQQHVHSGDRVALFAETSFESVAATLACFHRGVTLIPLSVDWPGQHLKAVLEDARPGLILHQTDSCSQPIPARLPSDLIGFGIPCLSIHGSGHSANFSLQPPVAFPADLPAYLLYTSGSSGKPKGVLGTHAALVNRLQSLATAHPFEADEAGLLKKAPIFIGFFTELLDPLLQGRPLVIPESLERRSPQAMVNLMARYRISRLWAFPSLLASMIYPLEKADPRELRCLKYIFSSGEILSDRLAHRLNERFPSLHMINIYGSTELASDVALYRVPRAPGKAPAIGFPLDNTQLWTLTPSGALQPPDLPGQLVVGGAHLAQAYWRQPTLTAWCFRPNPFSKTPGSRLFHTQDWVSTNLKTGVCLHRRMDQLLKVRGYQVDPQSVETTLREHPQIQDAAVIGLDHPDDRQEMAAFIVASKRLTPAKIRHFLGEKLPPYTLPTHFVFKKSLPRTLNGKILPAELSLAKLRRNRASESFVPPRNEKERLIAQIWADSLGKKHVGIFDNFFDLGGHSLIAAQIRARLIKALGQEIPLSALFTFQTIATLVSNLNSVVHFPPTLPVYPLSKRSMKPSFAQERWWFLQRFEPGHHYQLRRLYRLQNVSAYHLEAAMRLVVLRHQPLRTTFREIDGRPKIEISMPQKHFLKRIDLSGASLRGSLVEEFLAEEQRRPFVLAQEPGFRALWLDVRAGEAILVLHFHHIAVDAWAIDLFRRELARCYQSLLAKQDPQLQPLPATYGDFAQCQRLHLRSQSAGLLKQFWQKKLKNVPALQLPFDFPRPSNSSHRGQELQLRFSRPFTRRLQQFSRDHNATLYMVLLAAYRALLQQLSDQGDFCIGTPIANRNAPEWEPLIGAFVNTLAVRICCGANPTFQELLQETRKETLQALDHQDLSFAQVVEAVNPARDPGKHPLFQVMFAYFNRPKRKKNGSKQTQQHLFGRPIPSAKATTLFDLNLYLGIDQGQLRGRLTFSSDLFMLASAKDFRQRFMRLLRQVIVTPQRRLAQLHHHSLRRERMLKRLWGGPVREPKGPCLPTRIARQLRKDRDRIALVAGRIHLSKGFLNQEVQALATRLQTQGIAPEVPVAICMRRSAARVVAQLAALRAGGAMVLIHPDQPRERLHQRINLAAPRMILCDPALEMAFAFGATRVEPIPHKPMRSPSARFMEHSLDGDHAAYLLFTSGSTGQPKLTVNHHRGLLNRILQTEGYTATTSATVVLHKTPFEFDVSIWELFWPLLQGLRMEIAPENAHRDPRALLHLVSQRRISHLHFVPSVLSVFLEAAGPMDLASIQEIFTSGEALPHRLGKQLQSLHACRLHNLYGPTEAAIEVSHSRVDLTSSAMPTLGRPLRGNSIAILDGNLIPVSGAQPGQLYLGGCQIARCYDKDPRQTAKVFLPNPFGVKPGARRYASGDRGKFDHAGNIIFLGRVDRQVKLRGVRIELGEIEAKLMAQPQVRHARVIFSGNGAEASLTAYVVLKASAQIEVDLLRQKLQQELPSYLVPNRICLLPKLPQTESGKIDDAQLRRIPVDLPVSQDEKPTSYAWLWDLWTALLDKPPQNSDSDFFNSGGNSLLMVRLANSIHKHTGWDPPLVKLFQASTLRQQIVLLEKQASPNPASVVFHRGKESGTWLFIPPATGMVHAYRPLAEAVAGEGSCVGFQSHFNQDSSQTIPQMAHHLCQTLARLSFQPPFRIIGWSSGGVLAYEMAQQLSKVSRVEKLGLLDCRRFDKHPLQRTHHLLDFLNRLVELPRNALEKVLETQGSESEQPPDFSIIRNRLFQVKNDLELPTVGNLTELFEKEQQFLKACTQYQPKEITVPLMQIHAADNRVLNGWRELGSNTVLEFQSKARHFELLQVPWVAQVAHWLVEPLPKSNPSPGS